MTKGPDLVADLGTIQALANSLQEVLDIMRQEVTGLGLSALLCADAALTLIVMRLETAEEAAIALEKLVPA